RGRIGGLWCTPDDVVDAAVQVEAGQERTVALRRAAIADEPDRAARAGQHQPRHTGGVAAGQRLAGICIAVLRRTGIQQAWLRIGVRVRRSRHSPPAPESILAPAFLYQRLVLAPPDAGEAELQAREPLRCAGE